MLVAIVLCEGEYIAACADRATALRYLASHGITENGESGFTILEITESEVYPADQEFPEL